MPDGDQRRTGEDAVADRKARQAEEMAEIKAGLRANAGAAAERLIGAPPTFRNGANWRFYARGGLNVGVQGSGAGLWHDKGADKGGDMLALIQHIHGGSFPDAVAWARDFLGMPEPDYAKPMTAEDRQAIADKLAADAARRAQEQLRLEAEVAARQEEVARRAQLEWDAAPPAPADHPYAVAKGVPPDELRIDRHGNLLAPMRDDVQIWGLQRIAPDGGAKWRELGFSAIGGKMFPAGGRKENTYMVVGTIDPERPLAFAEGWATGKSVSLCTSLPVIIAWDIGNKHSVMSEWRRCCPDMVLVDAADNDHAKPRMTPPQPNRGAEMAARLHAEIGSIPALPPFAEGEAGSDWNDYHRLHGAAAVAAEFARLLESRSGAGR